MPRESLDVDFEAGEPDGAPLAWDVAEAIERAAADLGVPVEWSEAVGRWSMVDPGDYRASAREVRRYPNGLVLRVMDPVRWAVGKLARGTDEDLRDVAAAFRAEGVAPAAARAAWVEALAASPLSLRLGEFLRNLGRLLATDLSGWVDDPAGWCAGLRDEAVRRRRR